LIDHSECSSICRVVVAEKRTVVNGEAVGPEMEDTLHARWRTRGVISSGVFDDTALGTFAPKCDTAACEAGVRFLILLIAGSGDISVIP
jgi:hypothetical protein